MPITEAASTRKISRRICRTVLATGLALMLGGCDIPSAPPVPDWPGPHASYPFPDNLPHRTE
ncbi:hypothetical protein WS61_23260 [Burkholderia sp. ABCPW 11]|nr:hypothetical protein WS61_23260 [Burkholderia sp. ABCPW 11]